MTTPRTRAQTAANPTNVELKTKAFDERRALWVQEDEREEERLRAVGKTLADALLNSVVLQGDLQREDLARLLCKVLAILDFRQYFLIDETSISILQRLMDDFEEYSNKLVDPDVPDQYIRDLPLENLKIMLTARRGQLCARLELLRNAHNQLQSGQLTWDEVFVQYKTVAIQFWMEMLDLTLVLRYRSGDALKEELQARQVFLQESLTPVMDMFLMEVRDKQVRRPILYIDYMVMSPPSGTIRGDGSEASVDTVLRSPNEEEMGQMGARVEVMTLGPTNVPPVSTTQNQPERAAAQAMGRPVEGKYKGESLKKIISLPGVSSDRKLQMLSQQLDQLEKKPADQLDALAGRFNLKTEEASTAAYGDEKAVAQYNALPNVQLPPFYGNSLEFAKWWQMFIYLVDKNPKIPQIMKLHLLQKSLKGNAEYLTHQITFSPSSYAMLKENVKDAFDDADAALRLLTERIRAWPVLKRNDYKQLADFTGFATNYVMQLMHFEDGAAFNPRNVINDLYGKFYPQMMGDYRRDWAQEEFMKGKRSDRDQVVWLLQWLKEKLKWRKPTIMLIPTASLFNWVCRLELPLSSNPVKIRRQREAPTRMLERERRRKRNRRLQRQMAYMPQPTFVLPILLLPPVYEEEGGASAVEGALREDAAANQIAGEENRQLAPLPLDLLRDIIMREQHRIPQRIFKAGKLNTRDQRRVMIFYLAFSAVSINIPQEVVRST